MLEAIKVKSSFIIDSLDWILGLAEILLAIQKSPACDELERKSIQGNAGLLLSLITLIPDEKESIRFISNYPIVERLFETALKIRYYHDELSQNIFEIIASLLFKKIKYYVDTKNIEDAILALSAYAIILHDQVDFLKFKIEKYFLVDDVLNQENRKKVASGIQKRIREFIILPRGFNYSYLDKLIASADKDRLNQLVEEISELILLEKKQG